MPTDQAPQQIQPESLDDYLEVMSKSVFQSGMSWKVVEAKWSGTREAFQNFDVDKVAHFSEADINELTQDTRVIRNRRKLAAVVSNAQKVIELDNKFGSFKHYLGAFDDFNGTLSAIKNDFKFMGPTGIYFFLYVVGEKVPAHEEFEKTYRKK